MFRAAGLSRRVFSLSLSLARKFPRVCLRLYLAFRNIVSHECASIGSLFCADSLKFPAEVAEHRIRRSMMKCQSDARIMHRSLPLKLVYREPDKDFAPLDWPLWRFKPFTRQSSPRLTRKALRSAPLNPPLRRSQATSRLNITKRTSLKGRRRQRELIF